MNQYATVQWWSPQSLWVHRSLMYSLIKREIAMRYKGSMLGLFWSFFNPILMLAVYTFVFSVVFRARWKGGTGSNTEFALVLFTGLMAFGLCAECLNRAPSLILGNANYVKKVIFPLEILPVVVLGSATFHFFISLLVWLIFYVMFFGIPPLTLLLLPFALLPLLFLTLGLSWFLASLGVYLRDVSQIIGVFTTMLMFLSPIFYPISALPEQYQIIMHINPLTTIIEQVRGIMIFGDGLNWLFWSFQMVFSLVLAWLGFAWFQKTRKGFADVI